VGRVVGGVLEVIGRGHKAVKAYVRFESNESKNLNLRNVAKVGSVIGVRNMSGERFGEVVGGGDRVNVRYFDDGELERNVGASRIAGIQDESQRQPMLLLIAGEGGAKEMAEGQLCLGHLGLGLKWVKDVIAVWKGDMDELKMIAERIAVLMVCEMELGREKGMNLGDDIALMCYDLFGQEGSLKRLISNATSAFIRDCLDGHVRRGNDLLIGMQGGRGRAGSKGVFGGRLYGK